MGLTIKGWFLHTDTGMRELRDGDYRATASRDGQWAVTWHGHDVNSGTVEHGYTADISAMDAAEAAIREHANGMEN